MPKYYSILDNDMKPKAGPKVTNQPRRSGNQAGPRVIKPAPKTNREMPKRVKPKAKPIGPDLGIMGSTPKKKAVVKQRMLDDMRKRGMLSKVRKKKM